MDLYEVSLLLDEMQSVMLLISWLDDRQKVPNLLKNIQID